jgi:hypothetical protein
MSNLRPITEPDKIATAIMASDALGLAGSSTMAGSLRVTFARELVGRINKASAALDRLGEKAHANSGNLSPVDDQLWSSYESQIETSRATLQSLVAELLGVTAQELVAAL